MKEDLMELKRIIKNKICLLDMRPNYPLGEFVRWVDDEKMEYSLVVVLLGTLQTELNTEEIILRRFDREVPNKPAHLALHGYWRLYCAQALAYFRSVLRDANNKQRLAFLLDAR